MKFSKIKIEWIIIAGLIAFILLRGCGGDQSVISEKTTTTTVTNKTTEIDSASNEQIKNMAPEIVKVIEYRDRIKIVNQEKELTEEEKKRMKPANRYRDTTYFNNARVISDIIAEGRILKKDLIVEIDHFETITTTKKSTVVQSSGLFIAPAVGYSPVHGVESVEASLMYLNKGDFGISAGAFYNLQTNHVGFKIGVVKKLF